MKNKKTLNEHLFEQLERLSNADKHSIDIEKIKAASMVSVSEQILNVARLKLEIIQASKSVSDFSELDSVTEPSESLQDSDKKKLTE